MDILKVGRPDPQSVPTDGPLRLRPLKLTLLWYKLPAVNWKLPNKHCRLMEPSCYSSTRSWHDCRYNKKCSMRHWSARQCDPGTKISDRHAAGLLEPPLWTHARPALPTCCVIDRRHGCAFSADTSGSCSVGFFLGVQVRECCSQLTIGSLHGVPNGKNTEMNDPSWIFEKYGIGHII